MRVKPEKRKNKRRIEVTKNDIIFEAHFSELLAFKERFGHCDVPHRWNENKSLGNWVIKQREHREYLSPERYQRLEQIGFNFNFYEFLWEKKYQELNEYYLKNGHSKVPNVLGPNKELGGWVGKQRRDFKKNSKTLTWDKISKLNKLDFYWGIPITPWEKRFNELKKFNEQFGHCRVPHNWKKNPPLARWVSMQRNKYKLVKLSFQRYKQLESIGFEWRLRERRSNNNDKPS